MEKQKVIVPVMTVFRNTKASKEGILIGYDGRLIYNDTWMHEDVEAEDRKRYKKSSIKE